MHMGRNLWEGISDVVELLIVADAVNNDSNARLTRSNELI